MTTMAAKTLLLLTLLTITSSTSSAATTFYEVLEKYGLPIGLFPDSIKSYTVSPFEGTFVVELEKPCYIQFRHLVHYETNITGKLKDGSITNLAGIQIRFMFSVFGVDTIRVGLRDGIYFHAVFVDIRFYIGEFKTIRSCQDHMAIGQSSNPNISQLPAVTFNEVEMLATE